MKHLCIGILLVFVLNFFIKASNAQNKLSDDNEIKAKVDDMAEKYLNNKENAGIVFGIIKDGFSEPLIYAYGYADKSIGKKLDANTLIQIGSITKVFTGTLLAKFVQEGKVSLNDPVQKFLTSGVKMPGYDNEQITLLQLAEHTSGLPRMALNFSTALKEKDNPYINYTSEYLYKFLNSYKMKYAPGKHWQYSNLAFGLLGEALSLEAKRSFEELIIENICNSLEMPDTRMTLNEEQNKIRATGYNSKGTPVHEWTFSNCTAGAGALFSSINDMMKWLKYNMGISKTSISDLINITEESYWSDPTQVKFSMGLGWQIDNLPGGIVRYNKNGGAGGCVSVISFTKDPMTGVVILANSGNGVTNMGFELTNYLISN